MKATEVQIGDWARFKEDSFFAKHNLDAEVQIDLSDFLDDYEMSQFIYYEPIPLTLSILSANDWTLASGKMVLKGKSIRLGWDIKTHKFYIGYGELPDPVEYVHQVQHIMRVCGMEEEANNFNVI